MVRLFWLFIYGCAHRWETVDRKKITRGDGESWTRTYCVCSKCGLPKKFD